MLEFLASIAGDSLARELDETEHVTEGPWPIMPAETNSDQWRLRHGPELRSAYWLVYQDLQSATGRILLEIGSGVSKVPLLLRCRSTRGEQIAHAFIAPSFVR